MRLRDRAALYAVQVVMWVTVSYAAGTILLELHGVTVAPLEVSKTGDAFVSGAAAGALGFYLINHVDPRVKVEEAGGDA